MEINRWSSRGLHRTSGASLTELMIAVVILVIGALGVMGAFSGIARGLLAAKARGLASNLAQEKVQVIKQKNYYRVMVTTQPVFNTDFSPAIPYDNGYFPPEQITEGGIAFTRLTCVQRAQEVSGEIQAVAPTSSDTNMKLVTVSVVWTQGGRLSKLQVNNVMSNPDASRTNGIVTGRVSSGGVGVRDAVVTVAENSGWVATTNSAGDYTIDLFPGDYNLVVTHSSYFDATASIHVSQNTSLTQNMTLVAKSSRTLSGYVWINNHPVISRVVGHTVNPAGFAQEFVELYNPTTWTWTASSLGLQFARQSSQDATPVPIAVDFTGAPAGIAPGGFYVFANTRPLVVGGSTLHPDAVWESAVGGPNETNFNSPAGRFNTTPGAENYNIITVNTDFGGGSAAGGVRLFDTGTGCVLDRVGWSGNGGQNPHADVYETLAFSQSIGLEENESFARKTGPSGIDVTWGPAYDSDNNNTDFSAVSLALPRSSAGGVLPVVTGTPAVGAVVSVNDDLSSPTTAVAVGNPPSAQFVLSSVATGTWTVFASLNSAYQEIGALSVPVGAGTIWVPDATTTPPWPVAGQYSLFLSALTEEGVISGTVKNPLGQPINPSITVTNGINSVQAATTGTGAYLLRTLPGVYTLTANGNHGNPNYVSDTKTNVTVTLGQVTSNVDFVLSQGGGISGFISRDGVNPLPGVGVSATKISGEVGGQEVSGADGRFQLVNLSTGDYTVAAVLASRESATPETLSATVTMGTLVFAGTFTVTGAMGYLGGTVTAGGVPIPTGVMVVASTYTMTATLPVLNLAGVAGAGLAIGTSREDGTYLMEVRGSTTQAYSVSAFYPVRSENSWSVLTSTTPNVSVLPGAVTSGVNFSW